MVEATGNFIAICRHTTTVEETVEMFGVCQLAILRVQSFHGTLPSFQSALRTVYRTFHELTNNLTLL